MAIRTPPNLPVVHDIPEGMPLTYANYTYTQTLAGDFILSFFQATQPIALTEEEAAKIDHIPARCVARIAMNTPQILALMMALQDLMQDHLSSMSAATAPTPPTK